MPFFNQQIVPDKTNVQKSDNCSVCKLYETCTSPKLRLSGDGNKKVLIVGSYPYKEEDRVGVYGRDKEMYFLIDQLESLGISFEKDCWYTTAVNCKPIKGDPTTKNVNLCRSRLLSLIDKLQPKSIILLGEFAFDSLIGPRLTGRITGTSFSAFVGECVPDQEIKRWVCPVWPVSYLFSKKAYDDGNFSKCLYEKDPSVLKMWKEHLQNAFECATKPFYTYNYDENVFTTTHKEQAIEWLHDALAWEKMSYDFETTGLKPYVEGHRIYTAAICNGLHAFAFPFFDDEEFRTAWNKLTQSDVGKIIHNAQYEFIWEKVRGGVGHTQGMWPKSLLWDSMNNAHILDNQKPTSQKFLVYTKFGVIYDESVDEFLKPTKEDEKKYGANAINQIDKAPMEELLHYNGLDAFYCHKLYEMQNASYLPFQKAGIDLFHESAETFAHCTYNGFRISEKQLNSNRLMLTDAIQEAHQKIMDSPEAKLWDREEPFNYDSSTQLSHLLFDVLKIKPLRFTAGGKSGVKKPSVDKEALPLYDVSLVKDLLHKRHLSTVLTKLEEYDRERSGDFVHASFNLNRVDTFRPSGDSPNLLNIFKREEFAKKIIRSALIPRDGHRIVEYDYKAIEVGIGACYHHDPTMIKYLTSSDADMHKYFTEKICKIKWDDLVALQGSKEAAKAVRQDCKGNFTFAEFYGSFWRQVAVDLWEDMKRHNLLNHLKSQGIKNYKDFEKHIEEVETDMWDNQFPVYKEWRIKQYKDYQKKGYVDLLTGFRAYGPMSRNNSFNTPVQGAAYHVLQWYMNQVRKVLENPKKFRDTYQITQIYDAHVNDVDPSEEDMLDYVVWYWGTQKVMEQFPWICVPLVIEKERSEVNGNWGTMVECGVLKWE